MANIKIEGQKELQERLKKIESTAKTAIEQALLNSALIVERDAKINAPVDTGRLRSSIMHRDKDFGTNEPMIEVGTNVEYAPYVEFGTSKAAAQPFLFPALNSNKQKILKEIAKALKKGAGL